MKVELINYTPNPDRICAAAALSCHSKDSSGELICSISEGKVRGILKHTIKHGHHSVIEHASFNFSISGVSRALTHQLVRHRIASYSQQSQRYVKLDTPTFVIPSSIEKDKDALKEYNEFMGYAWRTYDNLIKKGLPPEDARFVLPSATTTSIMVTMNARELINFFSLRCCMRAQWEIREMAWMMLEEARKVAPIIFENAGPPCDSCPEPNFPCKMRPKH